MELNAEQIIKALELCTTTDDCVGCPYLIRRGDGAILPCTIDADALALIKQLTEEVADLKAISEQYQKQFEDCYEEKAKLTEENERWRAIPEQLHKEMTERMVEERKIERKLAVREMQERIRTRCIKGGIYPAFVARTIDQIAKEMLEGKI